LTRLNTKNKIKDRIYHMYCRNSSKIYSTKHRIRGKIDIP